MMEWLKRMERRLGKVRLLAKLPVGLVVAGFVVFKVLGLGRVLLVLAGGAGGYLLARNREKNGAA